MVVLSLQRFHAPVERAQARDLWFNRFVFGSPVSVPSSTRVAGVFGLSNCFESGISAAFSFNSASFDRSVSNPVPLPPVPDNHLAVSQRNRLSGYLRGRLRKSESGWPASDSPTASLSSPLPLQLSPTDSPALGKIISHFHSPVSDQISALAETARPFPRLC